MYKNNILFILLFLSLELFDHQKNILNTQGLHSFHQPDYTPFTLENLLPGGTCSAEGAARLIPSRVHATAFLSNVQSDLTEPMRELPLRKTWEYSNITKPLS
jgi:hypothetical protein